MRLIDADALCESLLERWDIADKNKEKIIQAVMADVVTPIVVSQPTVVVMCKECVYYTSSLYTLGDAYCYYTGCGIHDDDYCSHGKRASNANQVL